MPCRADTFGNVSIAVVIEAMLADDVTKREKV